MTSVNLFLLRHGELTQTGILCGASDLALSEKGKQQLWHATQALPKITQCISSPLLRCADFAKAYTEQQGIELELCEQIKELNFGDWDGKTYESLWQNKSNIKSHTNSDSKPEFKGDTEDSVTLGQFWQDPWACSIPNGEPMVDFVNRVDSFWQSLLSNPLGKNTLIISHGGVIRHILARVLAMPIPGIAHLSNIDVPYGSLIKLTIFIDENAKAWPRLML